jgi:hypothetical protein
MSVFYPEIRFFHRRAGRLLACPGAVSNKAANPLSRWPGAVTA